jgi:hypothetical protein
MARKSRVRNGANNAIGIARNLARHVVVFMECGIASFYT